MLRDKMRLIKLTLPSMSSGNTASLPLEEKLGIGSGEAESLQIHQLSGSNCTIAKAKNSNGTWKLVVTATGSVSANAVAVVLAQPIAEWDAFTLTKDA